MHEQKPGDLNQKPDEIAPKPAQRQIRHGLEMVHPASERSEPGRGRSDGDLAAQAEEDLAAGMMQAIEEEAALIRGEFTGRLISLERPAVARFQRLRNALHRLRQRARGLVADHPVQVAVALAGICLALGAALRLRRSHHL